MKLNRLKAATAQALLGVPALALSLIPTHGLALEQIARPYQSIRSLGMGGSRFTLGQYDDNFYGNPALVAENPGFRFTLFDPTGEVNLSLLSNISKITTLATDLGNLGTNISALTGKNNHVRYQQSVFSFYFQIPSIDMGFSFGLPVQFELNLIPRANNSFDLGMLLDVGPQISAAKKFSILTPKDLGVGLTAKVAYRLSTGAPLSIQSLVVNGVPKIGDLLGEGSHVDFDLGATFRLPWNPWDLEFITGMALGNILGGGYNNLSFRPLGLTSSPAAYGRNFGVGFAAVKRQLWLLTNTSLSLEFSEIGPNGTGNPFRSFHMGAETNFYVLNTRVGIHQGYLTFGAGLNLWAFTLDYVTYGEEMSLNPGDFQDRRHAVKIAFQIQLSPPKSEVTKPTTPEAPGATPPAEPKLEAPKVDTPKVEDLKAPKIEEPKLEKPQVNPPTIEAPKVQTPNGSVPHVTPPKVEAPQVSPGAVVTPNLSLPH